MCDFKATPDETHQTREGPEVNNTNQLQTKSEKIIENMLNVSFCEGDCEIVET